MSPATAESEWTSTFHVYEPHRAGLPKLGTYARELWRRREFAAELSKASMRAANTRTVFGQLWLVINPLLLASVYYLLVQILRGGGAGGLEYFAHLTAGLFTFYFVSGCMSTGAASVVGGGKLLLNTAFPRLLMPLSAVRTAFFRFLPTMAVYAVIHVVAGNPITIYTPLALVFFAMILLFAAGTAAIFAALQVYFRDTTSFLPYVTRIWLYLSPVLWFTEQAPQALREVGLINPLFPLLGGWSDLLVRGELPPLEYWAGGAAWAVGAALVGSMFFMSREREFAVRL